MTLEGFGSWWSQVIEKQEMLESSQEPIYQHRCFEQPLTYTPLGQDITLCFSNCTPPSLPGYKKQAGYVESTWQIVEVSVKILLTCVIVDVVWRYGALRTCSDSKSQCRIGRNIFWFDNKKQTLTCSWRNWMYCIASRRTDAVSVCKRDHVSCLKKKFPSNSS